MRILLVGAGGVGTAIAAIAARHGFAELVVADYDLARAQRAAAGRSAAIRLDARDSGAVAEAVTAHACDVLLNATDPRFVMPLFRAAQAAGADYLDMAMSLSVPHPAGGVLGPEALPAGPFLDLLAGYGSPWACEERTPAERLIQNS